MMKRLVQDIGKHLCLLRELLITGELFMGGMYVAGVVAGTVLMANDESVDSVFLMGTLMMLVALLFSSFFSAAQMVSNYNYAIAMGQTRRQTLPAYMVATFVIYLIFDLTAVVLHLLDRRLMSAMYPDMPLEDFAQGMFTGQYLFMIALAGTAFSMLIGAAIIRFGRAAYFAFWVLFMICFIGLPRSYSYLRECHMGAAFTVTLQQMLAYIGTHIHTVVVTGGLIGSALCLIGTWLILRRQQVSI